MTNAENGNSELPKILIAEDNKQTMQLMKRYFAKANERGDIICDLLEAYDGEETIQKIDKESPDWILCDIGMPKKDGFEVLTYFNKIKSSKPFIFFA